jgi:hypothetical protein
MAMDVGPRRSVFDWQESNPTGTLALTAFVSNMKHGLCDPRRGLCCSRANEGMRDF